VLHAVAPATAWETVLCGKYRASSFAMKGIDDCGEAAGSDGIVLGMRWMAQQKIADLGLTSMYDWFIITRSDFLYLCDHPCVPAVPGLWMPQYVSYEDGVSKFSEKHLMVSADLVLPALNTTAYMLHHPTEFASAGFPGMDVDGAIAVSWRRDGLVPHFFPRVMFTVTRDTDRSRWMSADKGWIDPSYGIHLKAPYRDELTQAQHTCGVSVNHYLASL
jgi:hypothetical protein